MTVYEYPKCISDGIKIPSCALALGFFDGVHIAHRELMSVAKANAERLALPFGIFTFSSGSGIKDSSPRLYADKERLSLFESLGADIVIMADFSQIRSLSPDSFVCDVLARDCGCRCCVAGFNFRFGKAAAGSASDLERLMRELGRSAVICDEMKRDGKTVSATLIRSYMAEGKIEEANALLGTPYFIKGRVAHGNHEGRRLGYPTVNMEIDCGRTLLRRGVYRSAVVVGDKIYSSLTNIGRCPTFDEREIHAETYILDFDGDLYGDEICVYLLGFLRDEARFSTPSELIEQINNDKKKAIKENGDLTWQELGLSLQ